MSVDLLMRWLADWGQLDAAAAGVLALVFVVAAFIPIPRTVLVLGAGAAFGLGSLAVIIPATTFGCVLAFLLARRLLRSWVERQIVRRPSWRLLARAVDDETWRILALTRFWGPLPNFAQNYLFAVTSIGLLPYTIITAIFTLPQIALYTALGAFGRAVLLEDASLPFGKAVAVLVVVVVLAIVALIARRVLVLLQMRDGGALLLQDQHEHAAEMLSKYAMRDRLHEPPPSV